MDRTAVMRAALWATALFNVGACLMFLFPASLGQILGLPLPAPRIYIWFDALVIGIFAGVYAWLARRPQIDRPLVLVAAIGKTGFFLIVSSSWFVGEVPSRGVALASADLIFAAVFVWWLLGEARPLPATQRRA
jgi:hypothetical protein